MCDSLPAAAGVGGGAVLRRIWQLVWKELRHYRRDRLLTPFIILGPILLLALMGWASAREVEHRPIAILDQDRSQASRGLITALSNVREVKIRRYLDSKSDLQQSLERGQVMLVVNIPPGFARALQGDGGPPTVQLIADGSHALPSKIALNAAEGAIRAWDQKRVASTSLGSSPVVQVHVSVYYNPGLKFGTSAIAAELGFSVYMVTLMAAAAGIARERELGTLEQLAVTPLRNIELIIGKAIPTVVIASFDFALMLPLVIYGFHIPLRGSVVLLVALTLLFILVELSWGLVISALSQTQQQAFLFVFMLTMMDMAFSGYIVSVKNLPPPLRMASNLFPIKHYLIIVRGIMVKGVQLRHLRQEIGALIGLGLASLTMALLRLRRGMI